MSKIVTTPIACYERGTIYRQINGLSHPNDQVIVSQSLTSFLVLFFSFAEATQPCKKVYLSKSDVRVTEAGICVHTQKGNFRVKSLRTNLRGVYAFSTDFKKISDTYPDQEHRYICSWCRKTFAWKESLRDHKTICPKRP